MKSNPSATPKEVILGDDDLIVSQTDLRGHITYISKDFLDISGFTESELLGQPHNVVRHPDMPAEAFEDLWRALKAGRPWVGYIKNRCKNGDYYWVQANIAPMMDKGHVTGYLSVRRKVAESKIAEMEQVYKMFRDKRQGRLRIRLGQVVKGGGGVFADLGLTVRIGGTLALLAVLFAILVGFGMSTLTHNQESVQAIYKQNLEPVRIIERIDKLMADNRAQILLGLQHDPKGAYAKAHDHPLVLHTDTVEKNIVEITALLQAYRESVTDPEHRKMVDEYVEVRQKYVQEGLLPARQALLDGAFVKANAVLLGKINPAHKLASEKADAISRHLAEEGKERMNEARASYEQTRTLLIWMLILLATVGTVASLALLRSLRRPMRQILDTFDHIAQGDFANQIDIARNDEMGKVLQGLQTMQTRMGFELSEARYLADQMTRIKIGLDHVTTNVRIADTNGVVVYANNVLRDTLRRDAEAFRRQDAEFDPEKFIGYNIGGLYPDPAAAVERLRNLTAPAQTRMELGGRLYRVTTAPVLNARGERLGSVGEWLDITDQVQAQDMLTDVIRQAAQGDFSVRLHLESKEAFFRQLEELVNQLLQTGEGALNDLAGILRAVATGDLTQKMEAGYQGIFAQLKDDTNATIERLREVVGRIKETTVAIDTASQEIAAGNQDLSDRTEEQASSLEEAASSMEQINAAVRNNAASAKQANDLAKNSNQIATQGKEVVGQVVDTMSGIQASSRKIADIVGVIDSIAFQTNILALNAAVEAARAGEQGRGFAVVATEVRSLAARSAAAAKEIKALIAESADKVENGVKLARDAGETMDDVVTSFDLVASLVMEIATTSREQSSGIEQVTQAVTQMDEVTQQNAALVEQAAAAAESLADQAHGLTQTMSMFKLGEHHARMMPPPGLRDVTPKQLAGAPRGRPAAPKKIAPPHLADPGEEWEEF